MNKKPFFTAPFQFFLLCIVLLSAVSHADPPAKSDVDLPPGFYCLRITDVENAPGTTSGTYDVMFEILNWSGVPINQFDVHVTADHETTARITKAWVDQNGAPFGDTDSTDQATLDGQGHNCDNSDDNFAAVFTDSGLCVDEKNDFGNTCGETNNFEMEMVSTGQRGSTEIGRITYTADHPDDQIFPRDVLNFGDNTTEQACALIPGCSINSTTGRTELCGGAPNGFEAVDNASNDPMPPPPAGGPEPIDNVLDGFAFRITGLAVHDPMPNLLDAVMNTITLNWTASNHQFSPPFIDAAFGRGILTVHLQDDGLSPTPSAGPSFGFAKDHRPITRTGPPLWTGPAGSNIGTHSHHRDIFEPTTEAGHHFEVEIGVGLTAPYLLPPPAGSPAPDAQRIVSTVDVPTLGSSAMAILVLLLSAVGIYRLRR